jgi:hypothetical protein
LLDFALRNWRLSAPLLLACLAHTATAATSAAVTVSAGTSLATIPATAQGVNTAVWDTNLLDASVPGLVSGAGITAMRYPGGSTSDTYNWQTNSIVPGLGGWANPANTFDAFMGVAKAAGATPIITVNYGSNAAGTGGGTPALAASWVQYANVTKSYGVKYWEIGNEVYGNGEYGGAWETDLHSAHDPATYGTNVAQFAPAMKAVDPTIKIGAVLAAPGNWPDGQSPDWNSNVLAKCGTVIDFVIVHWYPQNPGSETDAGLLGAPQSGIGGSPGIASMVTKLRALIKQYGGANSANIQILVTETNSVSSDPGKQTLSVVNALFIADTVTTWLENGVTNVDVWGLFNGASNGNDSSSLYGSATVGDYGILSSGDTGEPAADTPLATYDGIQMLKALGKPGDTLVSASSSNTLLAAHAVHQAGGNLAVMLINKDPANTTTATVDIAGFTPASTGTTYSYGEGSSAIATTAASGLGTSFSVAAPPYSITTVVLSPAFSATPSFSLAASPTQLSLVQGTSGSTQIKVAPAGGFAGSVAFKIGSLPSGVTAGFSPATSTGSTTLTFAVAATATPGSSAMTITGTSGGLTATTTVSLTVSAAPKPSFTLAVKPASLSLAAGATALSTVTVTGSGGFTGAVSLAAGGLPAGVTASFAPASTTGTSTLTLAASRTAAAGGSTITLTGSSAGLTASASLPLTVTAAASGAGPASFTGVSSSNSAWFDEEDVNLTTTSPITALTLTITVPAANVTYGGMYETIGSQITESHVSGATIVYTFTLAAGQTLNAGSWKFAAQMDGNGTTHGAAGDSWTVTYSAGGKAYTQSGAM